MLKDVVSAVYKEGYQIEITFEDGVSGIVDYGSSGTSLRGSEEYKPPRREGRQEEHILPCWVEQQGKRLRHYALERHFFDIPLKQ